MFVLQQQNSLYRNGARSKWAELYGTPTIWATLDDSTTKSDHHSDAITNHASNRATTPGHLFQLVS
jgi:hypothetical protein